MLRTAAFFGVDGVVLEERGVAPLSPVVARAAAGALDAFAPLFYTRSMRTFVKASRQVGPWHVLATAPEIAGPSMIIMGGRMHVTLCLHPGNEGSGISSKLSSLADANISIPKVACPAGPNVFLDAHLDSLNVSVALGIILSHVRGGV